MLPDDVRLWEVGVRAAAAAARLGCGIGSHSAAAARQLLIT